MTDEARNEYSRGFNVHFLNKGKDVAWQHLKNLRDPDNGHYQHALPAPSFIDR
jgi:hypothetical protein